MISIFRFVSASYFRPLKIFINPKNLFQDNSFHDNLTGVMYSHSYISWKALQEKGWSYKMQGNRKYSRKNDQPSSASGSAGQKGNREEFVFFFGPKNTFSQMHPAVFEIDGEQFTCMEQYMQWKKAVTFGDKRTAAAILTASDPKQHKKLGRQVKPFYPDVWGSMSVGVVTEGNIQKYKQNPKMKEVLFATYPKTLVEASPRDRLWGIGMGKDNPKARDRSTWRGKNLLGETLTKVRNSLMQEERQIPSRTTSVSSQQSLSSERSWEGNNNRRGDNRMSYDSGHSSHYSSKDRKSSPSKSKHRHGSHDGSSKHHNSTSTSKDKSCSQSRDQHGGRSDHKSKEQRDSSAVTSKDKSSLNSGGRHSYRSDHRSKEQRDSSASTPGDESSSQSEGESGKKSNHRAKERKDSSTSGSRESSDFKNVSKDDKEEGKSDRRPTDRRDQNKQIEKHSITSSKHGDKRKREDETKERHGEKTSVSECTPEKRPKYSSEQSGSGQKEKKIRVRLSLPAEGEEEAVNKERVSENQPDSSSADVTSEEKSCDAGRDV